jgi:hypothetical protein
MLWATVTYVLLLTLFLTLAPAAAPKARSANVWSRCWRNKVVASAGPSKAAEANAPQGASRRQLLASVALSASLLQWGDLPAMAGEASLVPGRPSALGLASSTPLWPHTCQAP